MAGELSGRERVWRMLHHREADRVGIMDSPWATTLHHWYDEGLPKEPAYGAVFGYDMVPISYDRTLRLPSEIVEDTDEHVVSRDENGRTVKRWKKGDFVPGYLDHLIKTRADWEAHKWLARWDRNRVDWEAARRVYDEARARDQFVYFESAICWDAVTKVTGTETLLVAIAADPEWVQEMFEAYTEFYLAGVEEMMGAGFEFDGGWVYNDMAYGSGTFFSPRAYDELFFPHEKRVCDFFKARDMPVVLHTDGRIHKLIPRLIKAGYACLQPLEVKAGMDLIDLKKSYGEKLAFMGGIDVRKMADPDPRAIEKEISSKIPVAMQGGGYIYHSDHSVPNSVSLERYQRVLALVRQYGTYGS